MLENVLEVGERPEDLVVYASLGKAARDWESYNRTVEALKELEDDETLVIQSGKPIGVFKTQESAPLVLMATSNVVGRWAVDEHWYELERNGLMMWGGYTAGDWQYIGSQGIVQGTYQTFARVAAIHFDGSLAGRLVVTAGLGGMGGAQPLAAVMAGGVVLCVEVNPAHIQKRIETGYLERHTENLDEALAWAREAMNSRRPASIGLLGNAAEVLPEIARRGVVPDVVTDQTSAHDLLYGYVPEGVSLEEWEELREKDPEKLIDAARASIVKHVRVMLEWQSKGAIAFEYGNNIRAQAERGGVENAFDIPIYMEEYIRPLFCEGKGPFRWVAISGDAEDIYFIDDILSREFSDDPIVANWVPLAHKYVQLQGLPARIAWLAHGERARIARMVNDAVASGDLVGPVAFTRDHMDVGGVCQPHRETENLLDGSDAVSDWPLLNALLTASSGADLVAIHGGGGGYVGYYQSAGVTVVADGTKPAAQRLENVLIGDTGIGVLRYADAGYEKAIETARKSSLRSLQPNV
jgi:urocanate hydratase